MSSAINSVYARCARIGPLGLVLVCVLAGCVNRSNQPEVVVYTALDREFAEPILNAFAAETGIRVRAKYDSESTKTVGLTTKIIAESKQRTRCDVFWNNEILNTLRLDQLGLLASHHPREQQSFPPESMSPDDRWFGFAARARVLIVNREVVSENDTPTSIYDLLDPKWQGNIAIAKPLFGSTASHAVCLFETLGTVKAQQFFLGLKENEVQVLSGNKQVAEDVASGKLAFGLTDTDDAIIELEGGFPVTIVYPDSTPGELGTLFIPNTLSLQQDSPNPVAGRRLLDYLLTAEVESLLAEGSSAQIPLHRSATAKLRVKSPQEINTMRVDFAAASARWDEVAQFLKEHFATVK